MKGEQFDLPSLMAVMKQSSSGRRTIQALSDKLLLHQMLDNLDVPQLPNLLEVEVEVDKEAVGQFVDTHLSDPDCEFVIVKPTHLSNGTGVYSLGHVAPDMRQKTVDWLVLHMQYYMSTGAAEYESAALKSLSPGFLIQPKYRSVVEFDAPMELRVVALWGKVRLGLWWWGRKTGAAGETTHRNTWMVRRLARSGRMSDNDTWEPIHEHAGGNKGFDRAIELFARHMPAMAATAEIIAKAFGAPFLRADFFVGSSEWGVRLNEVAYGCGVEYKWRPQGVGQLDPLVDDAPNIARILQEGYAVCPKALPAKYFLDKLGAQGSNYYDMTVNARYRLPWSRPLVVSDKMLTAGSDETAEECAASEDLCKTRQNLHSGAQRRFASQLAAQPTPQQRVASQLYTPRQQPIIGGQLVQSVPQQYAYAQQYTQRLYAHTVAQVLVPSGVIMSGQAKPQLVASRA